MRVAPVCILLLTASVEAGTIVGSQANVYTVNEAFAAPLDLVVSVVNDGAIRQHQIVETFVNTTGLDWMGFQHRLGLGEGDAFQLIPSGTGMDFDGPFSCDAFDLIYHGGRDLDWWTGNAPDGSNVQFSFSMSIPDSTLIPPEFHTADGYTFTLRNYPSTPPPPAPAGWWRGNTHTHSNLSFDSMDPPGVVAAFYEQLGYDFLVLTDHSWSRNGGSVGWSDFSVFSTPALLCISGEELTHSTNHTNGLGTSSGIIAGSIAENVAAILAQGAIPSLSHPGQCCSVFDILAVDDLAHMEIHNAFFHHGSTYTDKWDTLLSQGKVIWGMASDDTHVLAEHAGKGWIMVRSDTLDTAGILGAIEVGDFYASNGITLTDLAVDSGGISIESANGERVRFIGEDGVVLASVVDSGGSYQFTGQELYVRAEISNSYQQTAWTQPVFPACYFEELYVDAANCPGPGDGSCLDPYCSIQTAIDSAVDSDEIIVAPGIYFETINLNGKAITLRSSDGAAGTTIDAQDAPLSHVVQCVSGEGPDTVLDGLTFTGGNAGGPPSDDRGGGMRIDNSSPTVSNCSFAANLAITGGGMHIGPNSSPTVTNCTFVSNEAAQFGGGMYNEAGANPTVTNCTFNGNAANQGGGMYNGESAMPQVTNCILWGDTPDEMGGTAGSATVSYSNVQGGRSGTGNINANPLFADADGRLAPGSPCIDAADNTAPGLPGIDTDLDGNSRFVNDRATPDTGGGTPPLVDMGAYEFPGVCPWDCDGSNDGIVSVTDLLTLLGQYEPQSPLNCAGGSCDFDGDGCVDVIDFLKLLAHYDAAAVGCP